MQASGIPGRRRAPRAARLAGGLALFGLAMACGEDEPRPSTPPPTQAPPAPTPVFRDATEDVGLAFVHFTGATGMFYFPEIMGAGVCVLDYDGDGDLDIYFPQGNLLMPEDDPRAALFPPEGPWPPRNRLYRNDLSYDAAGAPAIRLVDVTLASGTGHTGYGMACAVGDYDGDGDQDLYLTNYGPNALLRNEGDGTFGDVTGRAGVDDPRWTTSASFLDYDRDGDLDLFHVNYVAFAEDVLRACRRPAGDRDYCTPLAYRPQPDALYRNEGDGTFSDVTAEAGIDAAYGNGLGVIAADFDHDGWLDVFVANDGVANQLWMNRGDGSFEDAALLGGVALNEVGQAEAGMGVSVADLDGDGNEDIFLTHLAGETHTFYSNQGGGLFADLTTRSALSSPSRHHTGFGTGFLDWDHDGMLDLIVVNGAVTKVETQLDDPYPYMMPDQLFHAEAPGRFEEVSDRAGSSFGLPESGRGLAIGDLDRDGDEDAVISNNNGPGRLLLNQVASAARSIRVDLEPAGGTIPVVIELGGAGRSPRSVRLRTDGSYCSSRDRRVLFGLGDEGDPVTLTLWRPDGSGRRWLALPAGRDVMLVDRRSP